MESDVPIPTLPRPLAKDTRTPSSALRSIAKEWRLPRESVAKDRSPLGTGLLRGERAYRVLKKLVADRRKSLLIYSELPFLFPFFRPSVCACGLSCPGRGVFGGTGKRWQGRAIISRPSLGSELQDTSFSTLVFSQLYRLHRGIRSMHRPILSFCPLFGDAIDSWSGHEIS